MSEKVTAKYLHDQWWLVDFALFTLAVGGPLMSTHMMWHGIALHCIPIQYTHKSASKGIHKYRNTPCMRTIPTSKKWTPPAPNYPWFSLGSNKYNHSKGSPLEELFSIREKGFVASKHTMFTNIISIGASQIIKLHSIANCQYTIVAKRYSTSIMCVYGSKLVRKLDD